MRRFWVLGPVDFGAQGYKWGVCDTEDLPGRQKARKPRGFQEFWPSEQEARNHARAMSDIHDEMMDRYM